MGVLRSSLDARSGAFVQRGVYRLGRSSLSGVRCSGATLPASSVVPQKQSRPASGVQRQSKPEIWAREDVRKLISSLVEGLAGFKIGPDSPFLESGLDSLSILSLSSQLSAALKRQVPAALISENPTIEQLSGALAMEARPALYLPLSSSTRLDFDVQISEESRRPHPSRKDPLFYLLMISSALVMIFEFLRHILRVCFFFEIGSVEAVFPERGEPLRFREVSELLPYDRVLRGYRMTHTLFFPYVVDEDRLKKSLSSTLAAYPSFASVIVERRGRTFLDWGDSKGVPFTVQTRRTPMRRKDFIQGSFQYAGDVSLAPDRWGAVRFFQKVRDAALSPWELLGRPALRVSVVRILSKPKGRWAPVQHSGGLNRIPASPNAAAGSENYPSSSYVTLAWSHALCDGPSMMAFLSHWAAACRGRSSRCTTRDHSTPCLKRRPSASGGSSKAKRPDPRAPRGTVSSLGGASSPGAAWKVTECPSWVFRAATWWPPCCAWTWPRSVGLRCAFPSCRTCASISRACGPT